jgi:hypothetical protein
MHGKRQWTSLCAGLAELRWLEVEGVRAVHAESASAASGEERADRTRGRLRERKYHRMMRRIGVFTSRRERVWFSVWKDKVPDVQRNASHEVVFFTDLRPTTNLSFCGNANHVPLTPSSNNLKIYNTNERKILVYLGRIVSQILVRGPVAACWI